MTNYENSGIANGFDVTELGIIRLLQSDGRMPTAKISRELQVSEPTVRRKLARLQEQGVIHVVAMGDPAQLGFGAPAYIGLDVERGAIQRIAAALADYPQISSVIVATGPYDIIIEAAFASMQDLYDFVLVELGKFDGIQDSQSFIVLQRFKMGGVKTGKMPDE